MLWPGPQGLAVVRTDDLLRPGIQELAHLPTRFPNVRQSRSQFAFSRLETSIRNNLLQQLPQPKQKPTNNHKTSLSRLFRVYFFYPYYDIIPRLGFPSTYRTCNGKSGRFGGLSDFSRPFIIYQPIFYIFYFHLSTRDEKR
ncbi:unnamed protein product [Tuber aestivum]|uniref:Uncharacterized protein n=1 Tax=Tuber aestivum TaxID=59557 RepID=A0A292Q2D7_9PEZI|nr:unnamed protein product [Tuber aestivum]